MWILAGDTRCTGSGGERGVGGIEADGAWEFEDWGYGAGGDSYPNPPSNSSAPGTGFGQGSPGSADPFQQQATRSYLTLTPPATAAADIPQITLTNADGGGVFDPTNLDLTDLQGVRISFTLA